MKSIAFTALAALLLWQCHGSTFANELSKKETPVLTINGQQWSAQRFAWLLEAGDVPNTLSPEQLNAFVDTIAERRLLAKQAEASGLASDPRIAERLALARDRILAEEDRARLRRIAPMDEAQVRKQFDANPGDYDELQLSQILVRITADDASVPPEKRRTQVQASDLTKSIRRQLESGMDFAELAHKYSDDGASVPDGGRLPAIFAKDLKTDVVPAIRALKVNQVSDPVLADDGYHLIRLDYKTAANFDKNKRLLEFNMRDAWTDQQIQKLRQKSPVSFDNAAWLAQRDRFTGQ